MVSDVVKWLTKWSPAHLSFAMQCTIHLNYLRSGKHTLCGMRRSRESSQKPLCIMWAGKCEVHTDTLSFFTCYMTRTVTCAGFVWSNSWKINGLDLIDLAVSECKEVWSWKTTGSSFQNRFSGKHKSACYNSSSLHTHTSQKQVGWQDIISCFYPITASDLC